VIVLLTRHPHVASVLLLLSAVASRAGEDAVTKPSTDPQELMKQLDRDNDGAVSKAEAQKLRSLDAMFDKADTNHDGKLDVQELSKALGYTVRK
jgi:EF hand